MPVIPASLPSHFAQNMNVAPEPNASINNNANWRVSTNETSVAHFATSMPNGAKNMIMMPTHHHAGKARHALEQKIHVLDVTAEPM